MKILTSNQTLLVKLLTAVTLCSLLLSVVPAGVFNARAEEVPVVSETTPVIDPVVEPVVDLPIPTEEPATTDEPLSTPTPELPLVSRIMSALPPKSTETIIVKGNTSAGENLPGWMFNRDITTATPFVFSTDQAVIGLGSLEVLPIGSNPSDKFVGEYFVLDKIANVLSYTYDFKIGAGGDSSDKDQFYLNVYANYGISSPTKFYDCRYDVVPTVGSTGSFTTATFDPTQAYPVTTRGSSPFPCPTVPADMNIQSADSTFRAFAINLGDTSTSDVDIDGYFDKVVLDTTAKTTTFDFEPAKEVETVKVHILKYLTDEEAASGIAQIPDDSTAPSFPMTATWNAANIGGGSGNYVLGNTHGGAAFRYGADTAAMSVPADYTTSEITGGDSPVLPIGAECTPGKYRLVGYKDGDTVQQAEEEAEMTDTAPVYTELDSDRTIIVVNESCDDISVKSVCEIGENLLQNGSFETPTVTDHGGQWEIFSTVANWVISLSDGLELWKNFNGTGAGLASEGVQNAELDGNDATKIAQMVTTIPGATYELTFDFSPRAGVNAANNAMDALVGGNAVLSLSADGSTTTTNTWRPQSYSFVATSTSTTIGFKDTGIADVDGGYGPLLDNAALCLTKMPDPAPTCSLTIKSDGADFVPEKNAAAKVLTGPFHASWITAIPASIAAWIWGDDPVVGGVLAETQTFTKSFNWTGGTVTGATLQIASDNSHDITLGSYNGGDATEVNYNAIKSYDVSSGVVAGLNTLSIEVENFPQVGGNPATNPAGLLYDLTITGTGESCGEVIPELPKTTGSVTMCKVNEQDVPQAGWTLTLLGDKVEDIVVPTNTSTGINTVASLDNGKPYVALASGTWNNQGGANPVDAEYSTTDAWATQMDGYTGYGTDILELQINSAFDPSSNWGAYNGAHTYAQGFTQAATATANFRIFDGTGVSVNEGWYGDNSGTLNVSLYEGYAGVTGENGCVTFTDVPFGAYTAGEVMQDGWEGVSGTGPVNTAYPSSQFTIVNQMIDGDEEPVPTRTHRVSGVKWNDTDGDGNKDDEPNLGGWTITAQAGDISTTTTTNESGAYHFNLPVGPWTISEVAQDNWQQTGLYQNGDKITLGGETSNNCSFVITTDVEATYTCDFGNKEDEEISVPEPTEPTSGRSSSGSKSKKKPTPQVLGASTSLPQCGIYLNDYMRKGNAASSTQVTKLQIFLNAVEIKLPVTGIFDDATDEAVRAFQLQHKAEVLTPWFTAGIVPHDNPTGWVYQLTRWKINNIVCPGSEAYPTLN